MYEIFKCENKIYVRINEDVYTRGILERKKKSNVDFNKLNISYEINNYIDLNWGLSVINSNCEDYWKSWNINFGCMDFPYKNLNYNFLECSVSTNDNRMEIKYSEKSAILIFHYVTHILYSFLDSDEVISVEVNNSNLNILDDAQIGNNFYIISKNKRINITREKEFNDIFTLIYFNDRLLGDAE